MRRIVVAFPKIVFAIILLTVGIVAQVDSARGAGAGYLLYALTAPGPTPDYTFGSAVATADVNGDGRADIIVGSPYENHAHVFSGGSGALLYSLSPPDPIGSAPGFGAAVAAGDVDGDGMTDVIVGAPSARIELNIDQGRVYVFSGGGTLLRTLDTPSPTSGAHFGSSVAAGDVNGDGKADIVVAEPDEHQPGLPPHRGRAYVFSGTDGSLIYTHRTPYSTQVWEFAKAVAAGDVNGDGRADVVVGGVSGSIYPYLFVLSHASIFSGADGSLIRTLQPPEYHGRDDSFGSALATADVNGDGKHDVFVGDPYFTSAYVFDGAGGALIHTVRPGTFDYSRFGATIAAGDVDGDGKADAIVGSPPGFYTEPEVGRTYAYSGADGSLLFTLNTPNPDPQAAASFGTAVAAADVEGDGTADVIVGAPDGSYSDQGWAYVFSHESDGDGCGDARELLLAPPTDPLDPWDFYSVPVPALFTAPNPTTVFRDGAVSALDAEAVWAYFLAGAKAGTPVYEQDLNRNGVRDGVEYDRSVVGPGRSGPPDGAVTAQDAQLALAQFKLGYTC